MLRKPLDRPTKLTAKSRKVLPNSTRPSAEPAASSGASSKLKNFDDYLERLPILSVSQKHTATFECDLDNKDYDPSKVSARRRA